MSTKLNHLSVLTHSPAEAVKQLAEAVIPHLDQIDVLQNRTGLVMLPYTDSKEGKAFHLGEILVAEAHIRIETGAEGYGMILGRDLEFAMAVAVLDAALTANIEAERINEFVEEQTEAQAQADNLLLRQVEATRIEMETF